MIIIIDGYNLLKQVFPHSKKVLDPYKKRFIEELAKYKRLKFQKISEIILVFDAGPLSHPTREIHQGVVVIYSGQRSTADDWIIGYIAKHKEKDLLVITKDRAIIHACSKKNTETMDVFTFYDVVKNRIKQSELSLLPKNQKIKDSVFDQLDGYEDPSILEGYQQPDELSFDNLMEYMSKNVQDPTKNIEGGKKKKGNPEKKSKKERLKERRLKKLK